MKFLRKIGLLVLVVVLVLAGSALAQEKGFLWDGSQWPALSYDAKVGYIKGVGNLADFENAASKGKGACISRAFADELKTKTVSQIVDTVDKYYQDNPDKLNKTVLEVIVLSCTRHCPPGMGAEAGK